jgi:hypothetical protein
MQSLRRHITFVIDKTSRGKGRKKIGSALLITTKDPIGIKKDNWLDEPRAITLDSTHNGSFVLSHV